MGTWVLGYWVLGSGPPSLRGGGGLNSKSEVFTRSCIFGTRPGFDPESHRSELTNTNHYTGQTPNVFRKLDGFNQLLHLKKKMLSWNNLTIELNGYEPQTFDSQQGGGIH